MKFKTMECATGSIDSFALKLIPRPEASLCRCFLNAYLSCHETWKPSVWGLQSIQRLWKKCCSFLTWCLFHGNFYAISFIAETITSCVHLDYLTWRFVAASCMSFPIQFTCEPCNLWNHVYLSFWSICVSISAYFEFPCYISSIDANLLVHVCIYIYL